MLHAPGECKQHQSKTRKKTYLESLANAEDNAEAAVDGRLDLTGDELVALLQDDAALAVADEGPVDVGVLELLDADLAGERAIGLVEDVLGGNADLVVGELAGEREVEGGRGDDDLGGGVELGGIEVVDDALDALGRAVPGAQQSQWWDSSRAYCIGRGVSMEGHSRGTGDQIAAGHTS